MLIDHVMRRKAEKMSAKELIEFARLIVLYASYIEESRPQQQELCQLAIECLKRAQELQADPILSLKPSDIPF